MKKPVEWKDTKMSISVNYEYSLRGDLFNHEIDLLQVVKNLYPYGVECDTKDETAVKLLKIKKLVQAAMNGEQSADVQRLGINLGNEEQQQLPKWDFIG